MTLECHFATLFLTTFCRMTADSCHVYIFLSRNLSKNLTIGNIVKFKASRLKCRKAIDTGTGNWHAVDRPRPKRLHDFIQCLKVDFFYEYV